MMAGITGAHHTLTPSAVKEAGPSQEIMNMIPPAHAKALMKLIPEKRSAEMPAYALASGIAMRKPGKKRTARMSFVACRLIRS